MAISVTGAGITGNLYGERTLNLDSSYLTQKFKTYYEPRGKKENFKNLLDGHIEQ